MSGSATLRAGWEALDRDDFTSAERIARQALAAKPDDGEAAYLLGSTLLFQERFSEALAPLSDALRLAPARGVGHRLGYCHLALGDFGSAERVLRAEVRRHPDLINAYNALGTALASQSRPEEALAVFLEAARRAPGSAEANANAASALGDLGRHADALPYLRKAVAAAPQLPDAHYNLGILLHQLGEYVEAAECFEQALRLAPRAPYALGQVAWNELVLCRWDRAAAAVQRLRRALRDEAAIAAPFVLLAASDSAEEQRLCAEIHVKHRFPAQAPLWRGEHYRHEKLRIAYLSNDFHEHATAYLAAGLFESHDRARFEVIAVSYGPDDGSPMRRRLMRAFDRFVDARSIGDAQAASALRDMEVDIAVDLKGHTTGARLGILAHRPAPVQATYLGFPGTTGAPFIDYLIADRFVVPKGDRPFYSESLAYLPGSYQVNDGKREIAQRAMTRADAGLPAEGFVFCCFNNSFKITPAVFQVWMRLLQAVSGSVLWLLQDSEAAARNLQSAAHAAGIDPARLIFAPRLPHSEHLARQRLAHLFLDTLPCNAHTTASDALWGGLPVLTCAGSTFAGRVAGSLLHAVGLPELVADSLPAYEELAVALAGDRRRLAGLRDRLAANRRSAPLFDTDRFRRRIEAAYRVMAQRQRRGEQPEDFEVNEE